MTLSFGNMTVNLNIFNVIKEIGDDEDVYEVNMIEYVVQNYVDHVSYDDPLKSCLVIPSCVQEIAIFELEFLHSIIEHSEVMEANGWAPRFEKLPPIEDRVLPLEEKPPKLEFLTITSQICILRGRRNFRDNHILLFRVRSRE